jgi:serine protease Do
LEFSGFDKNSIPFLDRNINLESGIYVVQVEVDGPASRAGIRVGDIITNIDGLELSRMAELRSYIYSLRPEEEVRVTVLRNGRTHNFNATLGRR